MFLELSNEEKEDLKYISEYGYVFNWEIASSERSKTVACFYDGNLAGLVEYERQPENLLNYLFLIEVAKDYRKTGVAGKCLAYVAKDSMDAGYDGFVVLEPKTVLYNYYICKYGAKPISDKSRKLYFDTEAAKNLINTYLEEEDLR